jgi:hypothetical protein
MKQESKKCTMCKEEKTLDNFYTRPDGKHRGHCKECHIGLVLRLRKTNERKCQLDSCDSPHYALGYCRKHHARFRYGNPNNLERVFNGATNHPRNLRKYGITSEEFLEMAKNGCQICGVEISSFVIDHDHNCCNEVPYCGDCTRGHVCHSCNINISKYEQGKMREDNPIKKKVIRYLVNHDIRLKKKGLL